MLKVLIISSCILYQDRKIIAISNEILGTRKMQKCVQVYIFKTSAMACIEYTMHLAICSRHFVATKWFIAYYKTESICT